FEKKHPLAFLAKKTKDGPDGMKTFACLTPARRHRTAPFVYSRGDPLRSPPACWRSPPACSHSPSLLAPALTSRRFFASKPRAAKPCIVGAYPCGRPLFAGGLAAAFQG